MSLVPDDPPAAPAAATTGADSEEVLEAGRPKKSRNRRLREQLLLAAVLLALVAAVARAMSHNAKPSTPSATTSSSTASRSAPDSGSGLLNGSVVDPSGTAGRTGQDPFACPSTYQCVESAEAGPSAVTALHAAFPAAVLESASTVRLLSPHVGQPLWFRQLTARNNGGEILVRVDRAKVADADGRGISRSGGSVVTYYEGTLGTYHVVVQVTAPSGPGQPLAPVQKLAQDVRLLGLS